LRHRIQPYVAPLGCVGRRKPPDLGPNAVWEGLQPLRHRETTPECDTLLLGYLHARAEGEEQQQLARVIGDCADRIITAVIRRTLRVSPSRPGAHRQEHDDADDVCGIVRVQLLARLKELKLGNSAEPIGDFRAYVASVTYSACARHLRGKRPKREHLKNRLRYLFTREPHLALWGGEGGRLLCGLAVWRDEGKGIRPGRRYRALLGNTLSAIPREIRDADDLIDQVVAVLKWLDGPAELEDLVNALSEVRGVRNGVPMVLDGDSRGEEHDGPALHIADQSVDVAGEVGARVFLGNLWLEIGQLPLPQRHALLLGLDELAMFPVSGIAGLPQIAEKLEMNVEDLARLWNELPLDDARIADRLALSRQQVINLRKSARQRLGRRVREWQW
jgi:hypothetical protein